MAAALQRRTTLFVVAVSVALAAAGGGQLFRLRAVEALVDSPRWTPVVVFAFFVAAQFAVFHVEFRGHAVAWSPSEIPLVLGLVLLSPVVLAATWVVAAGASIFFTHRPPWFKHGINASSILAQVALASTLIRASGVSDFSGWEGALAVGGPAMLSVVLGVAVLAVVVSVATGEGQAGIVQRIYQGITHLIVSVTFAVWTLVSVLSSPGFGALAAVVFVGAWSLSRGQVRARQDYDDLLQTHEFLRTISDIEADEVPHKGMAELGSMMRANWGLLIDEGNNQIASFGIPPAAVKDHIGDLEPNSVSVLDSDQSGPAAMMGAFLPGVGRVVLGERIGVTDRFSSQDAARFSTALGLFAGAFERARLQQKLAFEATHDSLTGLLSRDGFTREVDADFETKSDLGGAVLVIDIARFSEVNATLGFKAGDRLLVEAGQRIAQVSGPRAKCARLGGDSYAVFLGGLERAAIIDTTALLREQLAEPFNIHDVGLSLGYRVGIAFAGTHGERAEDLVRAAGVAADQARDHQPSVAVYQASADLHSEARLEMVYQLRRGLDKDEFAVHYQPKVDAISGRVVGSEALLRWSPNGKPVSPAEFIPYAEAGGLMGQLTDFVLDRALKSLTKWREGGTELGVAVNLSAATLHDSDLPARVRGALTRYDVLPALLTLEITESVMVTDQADIRAVLGDLRKLGVRLSVDDFGTGYSSLRYLKDLEVDELKLDRSFVQDLFVSERAETIARAVIGLGHNLGLQVVGEGIETQEAKRLLREMRCDVIQGFLVARPMPADKFTQWLSRYSPEALFSESE